jgi:hypothetical protein
VAPRSFLSRKLRWKRPRCRFWSWLLAKQGPLFFDRRCGCVTIQKI